MKVAVVTGAVKGLGREIAIALAKAGFTIVIHYRSSQKEAIELLRLIKGESAKSIMIAADLVNDSSVLKMFEEIEKVFGRVDLLVNNVGNFLYKPFALTSNKEFRDIIESNLYTTLYTTRAALTIMRKQKSGQVINIGAVGCERLIIREMTAAYFLGKTAVYVLTKLMAAEEARNGIRVNMISPASMKTDIFAKDDFPSGRPANAQDVVRALEFLISDENSYINGANIEVSGGFVPGFN